MNNLMLGDCLDRMKEIPDGSVDMILTDQPYGTTACKWAPFIPLEPMWAELQRYLKQKDAIVITSRQPSTSKQTTRKASATTLKSAWLILKQTEVS